MKPTVRRLPALAVASTALLLLAACGGSGGSSDSGGGGSSGEPSAGGVLNMLGTGDVDYMDPNVSYYSVGYSALRLWSRQLFTYPAVKGQTTTAAPDLAEEIPTTDNGGISKDGTTYTITLRSGAQWNTDPARPVTAEDVVRGVKRTCNPVQPFGGIPDFATLIKGYQDFCDGFAKAGQTPEAIAAYIDDNDLPGVVAKDDKTVVFTLTHPASYFVDMLTLPAFSPAPEEVLKYLPGSQDLGQHQVSDGPYQIESLEPDQGDRLHPQPGLDGRLGPHPEGLRRQGGGQRDGQPGVGAAAAPDRATRAPTWSSGHFPPPSQLPGLIAANDPNLNLGETTRPTRTSCSTPSPPTTAGALKKAEVRQALAYAMNRDNIIQVLGGPKVNPPLTHVLPPDIVGSQDLDLYPYDVDKAKSLLAEAGYSDGLTLKFLYRSASEGGTKAFQTVQQDLSDAGIKVEGVPSPDADFYTKYLQEPTAARSGVWDVSLPGWGPDWFGNAALSFFGPLFSGEPSFPPVGSNFGFYDNPATNKLIDQAAAAPDESTAASLWAKADEQVMEDAPFFPITSPLNANYHATQVNNAIYLPAIQNFDPANVWLSPDMQGG